MARVLVVDDEVGCRESVGTVLSLRGFDVQTAGSSQEAVELGTSFLPDVLVVDRMLGTAMDGLDVAEALAKVNPRLQIILITGYASADFESRLSRLPGAQCLIKPIAPSHLLEVIHKATAVQTSG